ncbi:MAG: hypothetical protein NTU73_15440 [Ignavibacteriae bacterium]|nr:hypothetical protein [Ignavibacteriota bacterium]
MHFEKPSYREYFEAVETRKKDYNYLKREDEHIIFAVYCAGVSVECLLKGYITKEKPGFDSRHNLRNLFIESHILDGKTEKEKEKFISLISTIDRIWYNGLRYASEKHIRREFLKYRVGKGSSLDNINKYYKHYISDYFEVVDSFLNKGSK